MSVWERGSIAAESRTSFPVNFSPAKASKTIGTSSPAFTVEA